MIFFDYNTPRALQESYEENKEPSLVYPLNKSKDSEPQTYKELEMAKKQSKFMQPMRLSEDLKAVVGAGPLPRTEVTKKLWAYIKAKRCQDPKNKRNIIADDKLLKVFGGKKTVNMFEMTKLVNKHLS